MAEKIKIAANNSEFFSSVEKVVFRTYSVSIGLSCGEQSVKVGTGPASVLSSLLELTIGCALEVDAA
jgi:hypothetical protein